MGRPPIGKKAMSPAQRQRRRRKTLKKAEKTEQQRATAARARYEREKQYRPMPPGVYYWKELEVRDAENNIVKIWRPHCRPLAACHEHLEDEDILALLDELHGMARDRGLDLRHLPPYPSVVRHLEDESMTLSGLPRSSRPGPTLDILSGKDD